MQALNVLLVASEDSKALDSILRSKYLGKLYATFECPEVVEVRFNTFKELAQKCKSLKIDLVLVDDEKMILQGIADVLRKYFVNCIAINSYWTKLVLSNQFAKNMLQKYGIDTPEILMYPKSFPLVLRADGIKEFVNSMPELLDLRQKISKGSSEIADTIFLEEFIEGQKYTLTSLFDGKNLITFSELSGDLVSEYNAKLEKMFLNEAPNFIGYINSHVILSKQKLFNIGFSFEFPKIEEDLLYIFISAIYQKLDEI